LKKSGRPLISCAFQLGGGHCLVEFGFRADPWHRADACPQTYAAPSIKTIIAAVNGGFSFD
jgi:hypothetical protein